MFFLKLRDNEAVIFLPFLTIKEDQNHGKMHLQRQDNLMRKCCHKKNKCTVDVDIKFLSVIGKRRCDLFLAFFTNQDGRTRKRTPFLRLEIDLPVVSQ